MDYYCINGGKPLMGEVKISGAKNAALPIIVASLLTDGETILNNVPNLRDIRTIIKVIECLGAGTEFDIAKNRLKISVDAIKIAEIPYDLVKTMRASVYVMGPLLARIGEASVSLPGGCAIGERPVDIHLAGFESMGAAIELEHGYIKAKACQLTGSKYAMRHVSVGATANLLMAAVLAKGKTVLENAAMEPDVVDLGSFLIQMGAEITGLGTDRIEIVGVKRLRPVEYTIIPDRIEAGTFLIAGAATRGAVKIQNIIPEHISACLDVLKSMGFSVTVGDNWAMIDKPSEFSNTVIRTLPFPGFPTDLQAPMMTLATTIPGINVIIETIFENRFTHAPELRRMGADITIEGNVAIVRGVPKLSGAPVMMSDLRAGAALIIAALSAEGTTEIRRIYHSDRGYENMESKFNKIGANIERLSGGIA